MDTRMNCPPHRGWRVLVVAACVGWAGAACGSEDGGGTSDTLVGDTARDSSPTDTTMDTWMADTTHTEVGPGTHDTQVEPDDCMSACSGRECGSDGCGGSCGTCSTGTCVDGACRLDCPGLAECVLGCDDSGCAEACLSRGTASASALMEPLVACALSQCGVAEDVLGCVLEATGGPCLTHYLACVPSSAPCGLCPSGTVCGFDPLFPWWCGGAGCPTGLGPEGECGPGNTSTWCDFGQTFAQDCDYVVPGEVCGWYASAEVWGCVTPCARECNGKDCGFDGCGGTCGDCDDSDFCDSGRCREKGRYGERCSVSQGAGTCAAGLVCLMLEGVGGLCTRECGTANPCPPYQGASGPSLPASCYGMGGSGPSALCFWSCPGGEGPCPAGLSCLRHTGIDLCLPPG